MLITATLVFPGVFATVVGAALREAWANADPDDRITANAQINLTHPDLEFFICWFLLR
jgi:hypothetical protein